MSVGDKPLPGRFGGRDVGRVRRDGCTEPVHRGSVSVLIDADNNVRRQVLDVEAQLEVEDARDTGYRTKDNRHSELEGVAPEDLTGVGRSSFRLPITDTDVGGHYQLTATGHNAENAVVAQGRVLRSVPASGERRAARALRIELLQPRPAVRPETDVQQRQLRLGRRRRVRGVNGDMTDNSFVNAGAVYVFR